MRSATRVVCALRPLLRPYVAMLHCACLLLPHTKGARVVFTHRRACRWVADVARRFLAPDRKTVDLVGNSAMKASASVRHLILHCTCAP